MRGIVIGGLILACALLVVGPAAVLAAGGHDMLNCTGCHSIHDAKGDLIFEVEANKAAVNPRTNQPFKGITALCLGCHETTGGMGIAPISAKKSHPYGLKPNAKVADVPAELLRDGVFECVGCHDPHPSNPNYKYLRVDTKGGANMGQFCTLCHSAKSGKHMDLKKLFDSMDQRKGVPAPPPAPATK